MAELELRDIRSAVSLKELSKLRRAGEKSRMIRRVAQASSWDCDIHPRTSTDHDYH